MGSGEYGQRRIRYSGQYDDSVLVCGVASLYCLSVSGASLAVHLAFEVVVESVTVSLAKNALKQT